MLAVRNEVGSQGVVLADLKREFRAKSSVHVQMGKLRLKRAGPGLSRRQILSLAAPSGSGKNGGCPMWPQGSEVDLHRDPVSEGKYLYHLGTCHLEDLMPGAEGNRNPPPPGVHGAPQENRSRRYQAAPPMLCGLVWFSWPLRAR